MYLAVIQMCALAPRPLCHYVSIGLSIQKPMRVLLSSFKVCLLLLHSFFIITFMTSSITFSANLSKHHITCIIAINFVISCVKQLSQLFFNMFLFHVYKLVNSKHVCLWDTMSDFALKRKSHPVHLCCDSFADAK